MNPTNICRTRAILKNKEYLPDYEIFLKYLGTDMYFKLKDTFIYEFRYKEIHITTLRNL